VFACVGWQVTLCDPIWQATPCSSEMDSQETRFAQYRSPDSQMYQMPNLSSEKFDGFHKFTFHRGGTGSRTPGVFHFQRNSLPEYCPPDVVTQDVLR